MIGGFSQNNRIARYFSTSITYVQDDLTWCVHRADALPEYLNIFRAYDAKVWLLLLTVIIVSSFMMILFSRSDRLFNGRNRNIHYMIWLILVPITLGMAVDARFKPKKTSFRFFFGILMVFGIIGVSTWSSFLLKTTLHTHRTAQVFGVDSSAIRIEH